MTSGHGWAIQRHPNRVNETSMSNPNHGKEK